MSDNTFSNTSWILTLGHIASIKKFERDESEGVHSDYGTTEIYNLGTGKGYSVLDMVEGMRKASGKPIEVEFVDRRPGDIAVCYADPSKAEKGLLWKASFGVDEMCEDAWRWQSNNPNGYVE